jgi:hypothetical protein
LYDLGEAQSRTGSSLNFSPGKQALLDDQDGMKVLPFEFVALEACLEAACSCLENEVNHYFF